MNEQFRIAQRPQMRGSQQSPAQLQPQARVYSYGNQSLKDETFNPELHGLVTGLAALNPALQNYAAQQHAADMQAGLETREETIRAGHAAAQQAADPRAALTGEAPVEAPTTVPQAYGPVFQAAIQQGLADRAAVDTKASVLSQYADLKTQPDWDPSKAQQWLQEQRVAALQGLQDPRAVDSMGRHFTQVEALIQGDLEKERLQKRDEARASTLAAYGREMFTADMDGIGLYGAHAAFTARARELGYTDKEAAQAMLFQVASASAKGGGLPELFDVFDKKDAEGKTLLDHNPQLAASVTAARHQAVQARDKAAMDGAEKGNAQWLMDIKGDINEAPEKVTSERILEGMTKFGPVQSPEQAAALWDSAQDALRKKLADEAWKNHPGPLWQLPEDKQKKALEHRAEPAVQALVAAAGNGDSQGMAVGAAQITQMQSSLQSSVPVPQLVNLFKTLNASLQPGEAPSATFKAAVEVYKALSGNPGYRDAYFNEDTQRVLEHYTSAVGNGAEDKAAYAAAYQGVSKEAKAAADAFAKTPEFTKLVARASKDVSGSSWWPRLLGGNGRPENDTMLQAASATELRAYLARNPGASQEQIESHITSFVGKNFVLDATTRAAIKVPPGIDTQAAQVALTELSKQVVERYKLGSRSDAEWTVQYLPMGTEGHYKVVATDGTSPHVIGPLNLSELLDRHRASKVLTPEEAAQVSSLRASLRNGEVPQVSPELLAKAEALKALKPSELQAFKDRSRQQFLEHLNSVPQMSLGTPTLANLQHIPGKEMKVDNNLTAKVARDLFGTPVMGPGAVHQGYAASLITMGEGVMLKAYDDPARGAGKNIGMGYNLNANKATVDADLKAAGVEEALIPLVKAGERSLTPDQAKRLLLVSMPRYEKQVQQVAEGTSPGLWSRMTPAQKAVMVDIAWQVGDPGKFKKAWAALASNDQQAFAQETKVFYTDRSGERKEDTRRGNLRAAMLAGVSFWDQSVMQFGNLPSSKLQAVALNQP